MILDPCFLLFFFFSPGLYPQIDSPSPGRWEVPEGMHLALLALGLAAGLWRLGALPVPVLEKVGTPPSVGPQGYL